MRPSALLALLGPCASAHYFFPKTINNGVRSADWEFIRDTENNPGSHPIEDISSTLMRCYEKPGRSASGVLTVAAGSRIGFVSSNSMGHPGPSLWYMARVPAGQNVNSWTPSGNVWFKIDQHGNQPTQWPPFESEMTEIFTTIPSSLAPGNYLLRYEHIGLHISGAPQHYIACAQLSITGSGSALPSKLVAFPGAYSKSDPGLTWNIYSGSTAAYPYPGPDIWRG